MQLPPKRKRLAGLTVIIGLLAGAILYTTGTYLQEQQEDPLPQANGTVPKLIEYADFNCPHCADFALIAMPAYMKANPPTLNTDVIVMTQATFKRSRLANQHVAGQAARYGIVMSGERLNYRVDHDDEYPAHWPETKQRLENTQECRFHFNDMVDSNSGNQKLMGFVGQQAIENALKGWLSTHNDPRTFGHELHPLWDDIRKLEDWSTQEMRELEQIMDNLFEYTRFQDPNDPGESLDWLTRYAIVYRYGRTAHIMSREQRKELQALLNDALNGIINRIHQLGGTSQDDLWTHGQKPWE